MAEERISPDEYVTAAVNAAGHAVFTEALSSGEVSLLGGEAAAVLGPAAESFPACLADEDASRRRAAIEKAGPGGRYALDYSVGSRSGLPRYIEERGGVAADGSLAMGVLRRIDAQKKHEAHLTYLASYDDLTGALNRARCKAALKDAVEGVSQAPAAFLLVGIDDLGALNADFGFDVGDQVIIAVAERLAAAVAGHGVYGRVAGTKFGVVLKGDSAGDIRERAVSILSAMRESVVATSAGGIAVSVCLGAVPLGPEISSADAAMAMAEAALDQARQTGPSSWAVFSETTEVLTARRRNVELSDTILTALNQRRLYLAFQPIVTDLDAPHDHFECLIRMRGENGEEIPAPAFIPAAERLGLVHLLDRRVLELATAALYRAPSVTLAVNISWETVKDPLWAEGYLAHLRANRAVADRITVELTETQAVDAIEASIEFVNAIKELGCRFAIDDFGAGYTSFRNLKALDIDVLKIDGSFVTGVSTSRENQLFVRTLLDLARNFGVKTVAEWVDNQADAMLLKGLGVDYLQGFLIGRPQERPDWSDATLPPRARLVG